MNKSMLGLAIVALSLPVSAGTLTVNNVGLGTVGVVTINSFGDVDVTTLNSPPAPTPPPAPIPPPIAGSCPPIPIGLQVREVAQSIGTKKTYMNKANQGIAVKFVATDKTFGSVGWIMPIGVTWRNQLISISKCRGDFVQDTPCRGTGTSNTLFTTTADGQPYCKLVAGQTYFVNIRTDVDHTGVDQCPVGATCGLTLELK